jgi:hypothetical protein
MKWKWLEVESQKNRRGRSLEFLPSNVPINAKAEVRGMMKVYSPVVPEPDVYEAAACCLSGESFAFQGLLSKAHGSFLQKLFF